jgi:glycosyltransferase involved in cell wall biosynthesis
LCGQTFRAFHVTLLDDGSTDDSRAVAEDFAGRLPMRIVAAEHRGRQATKAALAELALASAPYVLFLDSDIELPADALARLMAAVEADERVGAASARCRAPGDRWLGRGQAFLDDLFYESRARVDGAVQWIYGGAALYRSEVLRAMERRSDVTEDDDILVRLGARWRFPALADLVATHYGVATTLRGLWRRGEREGVRVCAMVRAYPEKRDMGNVARLAPLPIAVLLFGGTVTMQPAAVAIGGALLVGYVGAFLVASRGVRGSWGERVAGAMAFTFMNVGFGVGFVRERLRGRTAELREPERGR